MMLIKGGRDQLECELVREIFKPADNSERLGQIVRQLAPRGRLQLHEGVHSTPNPIVELT